LDSPVVRDGEAVDQKPIRNEVPEGGDTTEGLVVVEQADPDLPGNSSQGRASTRSRLWAFGLYLGVGALILAGVGLYISFPHIRRMYASPRDLFRIELSEKVHELVLAVREYDRGPQKMVKGLAYHYEGDHVMISKPSSPYFPEWRLRDAMNAIQQHFNSISLAFVEDESSSYDKWADGLRKDMEEHKIRLAEAVSELKEKYRLHPEDFRSLWGRLSINKDGNLCFVDDTYSYQVETALSFNLEAWIDDVRDRIKPQKTIDYSTSRGDPIPRRVLVDGYVDFTVADTTKSFRTPREFIEIEKFEYKTGEKLVICGRAAFIDGPIKMPPGVSHYEKTSQVIEPSDIVNVVIE